MSHEELLEIQENQDFDELLEMGESERQDSKPQKRRRAHKKASSDRPKCQGITVAGEPCPAPGSTVYEGVPYCPFHNPQFKEKAKEWQSNGGNARKMNRPKVDVHLHSQEDIVNIMEAVCSWVLSGNVNSRDGAVVVAAVKEARASLNDNIEKRLKAIEKSLKGK